MENPADEDFLGFAYLEGYRKGKEEAQLSWGAKFWVALLVAFIAVPLVLGWIALVNWLWGLL